MRRVATLLIIAVVALLSLGFVMLYSVSPAQDSTRFLSRQVIAGGIGMAGAAAVVLAGYRRLRPVAWVLLALSVLLLVAVLLVGVRVNGARRWFRFAGFQFQPSDFAKLALLVALAHYGAFCQRLIHDFRWGVVCPALIVGPVVGLVFLQPDWGTAMLLAAVSVVVLVVGGVRWRYIVPPLLLGVAGFAIMLALNPVRNARVHAWLHPEETSQGAGYQAWHARAALTRGAAFGVGLDKSRQKALLPEHQTDFLFAIIAEEFGYVGSVTIVCLFTMLFVTGIVVAWRAPDTFGMLLATGISFMIAVQALINIGVVSGTLPNKGLALPFISYGGSNLMMMMVCTGVLVSIALAGPSPPLTGPDPTTPGQLSNA